MSVFGVPVGAVAVAPLTLRTSASAQVVEDADAGFDESIVTAHKRAQTIQDAPLSLSAVSGEEMRKTARGSLDAVLGKARLQILKRRGI